MNARLKASIDAAQEALPEDGQNALADVVDLFASNYHRTASDDFSAAEMAEIDEVAAQPFVAADPKEVQAFFAPNGLQG